MQEFFAGVKKRCTKERQDGEREMKEGKEPMPRTLYISLAKYFWKKGNFFMLCYLNLSWNLGCRTNNTEGIKMCHIGWSEDALQIVFGVSKGNQDGERKERQLLYANPLKPFICPVLSLSVYLATLSRDSFEPGDALFFGGS